MDNLFFFPTIDDDLLEDAGCYCKEYEFSYLLDGTEKPLNKNGRNTIKLDDPLDIWTVESEGLRVMRFVVIEYPGVLKGPKGVVCSDAELGVCIIWNNRYLKQMGYIMPAQTVEKDGKIGYILRFHYNSWR